MPNAKQPNAELRLHEQLSRTLSATKASHDEVTQVLIHLLACQIASYDPLMRDAAWDCAVDTLDEMVEDVAMRLDANYIKN
jgi:hypothetical protein